MSRYKAWEDSPTPIWLELVAERWDRGGAKIHQRAVMLALDEIDAEREERKRYER
jgi:hypothetical protein